MKSKQVLSIKQMKHLWELGLDTSDASLYWVRKSHGSRIDDESKGNWFLSLQKEFIISGFTAYEIIPTYTKYPKVKKKKKFRRICYNCIFFTACADRYHRNAVDCKRFRFCSMCKST